MFAFIRIALVMVSLHTNETLTKTSSIYYFKKRNSYFYKKKNNKVETSEDSIKNDCTNATTSEVLDLLEKLYDLQNKN